MYIKYSFAIINTSYISNSHSSFNFFKRILKREFSVSSEILKIKTMSTKKQKSQKYPPGTITLQVLGSGAKGAPRSLYLFTDQTRYLFNCGEGTQRLAHEHRARLARLEHIFITQSSWKNVGGLPGLALTIQDSGVEQIILHGPKSSGHLFQAARRFIQLRDLKVEQAPCVEEGEYKDNVLSLQYALIQSSLRKENKLVNLFNEDNNEEEVDYYAYEKHDGNKKRKNKINNIPNKKLKKDYTILPINQEDCVCYILRFHSIPGMLCIEKCVEKRVPPGPLLGKLKSGENITLQDGTKVLAEEVRKPDIPGPVMLVVECPSLDYLDSFIENSLLRRHNSKAIHNKDHAILVVHFTPDEILKHPKYKSWMEEFLPNTKHLIVNESNTCLGSEAIHRFQYQLNLLHPTIFPLLQEFHSSHQDDIIIEAKTMMQFHLRPLKGLNKDNCITIKGEDYKSEVLEFDGLKKELSKLKSNIDSMNRSHLKGEYPKLTFLGTGSCIPNKTRNTSAILLYTSPDNSILLDCGEGTFGQLLRFYGRESIHKILQDLKAIYISHLHADHHMGLMGLIHEWKKIRIPEHRPLILIAPKQINGWLIQYDNVFEPILDSLQLIPNTNLLDGVEPISQEILSYLQLNSLKTCPVKHCPHSFGISIAHKNEWKLTYSGDTMPSDDLIRLGKNSDILIHEATMEDELEEEAANKRHCTMSQALDVGKKMNAQFTILTHFSQRYAKLPRINGKDLPHNVGIAFDNMEISFKDLCLLPLFQPSLKLLFHEHCEELDNKALKRYYRKKHIEEMETKTSCEN